MAELFPVVVSDIFMDKIVYSDSLLFGVREAA